MEGGSNPERRRTKDRHMQVLKRMRAGAGVGGLATGEGHRAGGQSGTLRAAVFGVNDGLVSNLSLVMGVAGAASGSSFVLLAGIAGLLAGAFSMAAGEYVSMSATKELFENQIAFERREQAEDPEAELAELTLIFKDKGVPEEDAAKIAAHLMADPEMALETHVREELGLDPDELGSPWGAAGSSFVAFVGGAIVPVFPYMIFTGTTAFAVSIVLSTLALLGVGAAISRFTGRNWVFSGVRMLVIGGLAATVTYAVGRLIGVSTGL